MTSGIRRKVDDLGRVVIPAGIRRSLGIREGDALEVSVHGDEVILSKPVNQCVFCHSEQELHAFRNKAICSSCAVGIGVMDTDTQLGSGRTGPTVSGVGRAGPTDAGVPPEKPDVRPAERRAVAAEGGLKVVRSDATRYGHDQEPPASTTAW